MEIANIVQDKEKGYIYGLMGNIDITTRNENISIVTKANIKTNVKEYLDSQKDISALKMVGLEEEILEKSLNELSDSELKKISLAASLIENKEYIVLNFYEKGLNNLEKTNTKRLLKKLASDYNKTVIIFTNDITFLWDIAKEIIYVDNKKVINTYHSTDYFRILDLVDKPEIINMINKIKEKNIKIENYKDVKDLLKAIYRIKEEKK